MIYLIQKCKKHIEISLEEATKMKVFELTESRLRLLENEKLDRFKALAKTIKQRIEQSAGAAGAQGADDAGSEYKSADDLLNDVEEKIISGEAQLSKAVDAQLGKTGLSAQDQYTQLMTMASEAAQKAAEQISSQVKMDGSTRTDFYGEADLFIKGAMFVYINVKYNNGNPNQSKVDDAMGLIRKVVANNQPKGGAQPVGRQSSARPQGQQGTVQSGGDTNALDAMAADRANRGF